MKNPIAFLFAIALAASSALSAQSFNESSSLVASEPGPDGGHAAVLAPVSYAATSARPFSRVAVGGGISPLGARFEVTTDLRQHFNLRGYGNLFNYSTSFTTSGITADAKMNMSSGGAALDYYPFHSGFRISPGVLFANSNKVTATASVPGGTSFTLNDQNYYSSTATPVNGNGALNLNKTNPALTITTGWGNTIPRKGGHWSFPFELGVALVGAPSLKVNLGGSACYDQAQTMCTDINSPTDPIALQIQSNLHAQVAKWTSDLEPLKTFPIVSFGVAYSFRVRKGY
jgi:hypothetical protein